MSDAPFVALAEALGERLVTKDRPLATAVRADTAVDVLHLHGARVSLTLPALP
jgi:predicted nucleic acid-binding protein